MLEGVDTAEGEWRESSIDVEVADGGLTVTIGRPQGGTNTCLNWLLIRRLDP